MTWLIKHRENFKKAGEIFVFIMQKITRPHAVSRDYKSPVPLQ
jgi:hypothetical protein